MIYEKSTGLPFDGNLEDITEIDTYLLHKKYNNGTYTK